VIWEEEAAEAEAFSIKQSMLSILGMTLGVIPKTVCSAMHNG
jgi:hypothetical protein